MPELPRLPLPGPLREPSGYGPRRGVYSGETFTYSGKMGTLTVRWNGAALKNAAPAACAAGINEVMALCVASAMGLVLVDTGNLKNSIQIMRPAGPNGTLIVGVWGAYAGYAIYQEIGPVTGIRYWTFRPYLRPSADRFYPELASRIGAHLAAA